MPQLGILFRRRPNCVRHCFLHGARRFEVHLLESDGATTELLFTLVKDDENCIKQYFTSEPTRVEMLM
jgi:hypothetical protein